MKSVNRLHRTQDEDRASNNEYGVSAKIMKEVERGLMPWELVAHRMGMTRSAVTVTMTRALRKLKRHEELMKLLNAKGK